MRRPRPDAGDRRQGRLDLIIGHAREGLIAQSSVDEALGERAERSPLAEREPALPKDLWIRREELCGRRKTFSEVGLETREDRPGRSHGELLPGDLEDQCRECVERRKLVHPRARTEVRARIDQSRKDRVGLVSFGGFLSWLLPASGTLQLYRVVDSLLQMDIVLSFATKGVDVLPPRSLPPKALVLALTPLLDLRSAGALLDLRARGFDLVVIEVSPVPFVEPGSGELAQLSYRLWRLSRESLRARYEQAGVPVVEWLDGVPLNVPLEEVAAFRRYARPARA